MSLGLLKLFLIIFFLFINNSTKAEPVQKNIGLFKLLNKSTNKVSQKKIFVNESAEWGTLNIELYACFSSPPNEIPENYALISVLDKLNKEKKDVYLGWIISSSPNITPLEHPIYDLWLVDCTNDKTS